MNKTPFNKSDLVDFKKLYDDAVSNEQDQFIYRDMVFATTYAKYVIEYLERLFSDDKPV